MSADRVPFVLMLFGLLSQFLCMIFSATEMMLSEMASRNSTQDLYSSRAASLHILSSIGDILILRYVFYILRYLGLILHFFAFYAFLYVFCNRRKYKELKGLLVTSGSIGLLQILGLFAQVARLVVLLLYTLQHACDSGMANYEPNYVLLGIATTFGFLSLIILIGYLFACMYNKSFRYDENVRANKTLRKGCEKEKLAYKHGSIS